MAVEEGREVKWILAYAMDAERKDEKNWKMN